MKAYHFNPEKNAWLLEKRGISFEETILAIEEDGLLDVLERPNSEQYKHQKIYVVYLNEYAYLVPFVDNGKEIFLKTAFPSRKAKKLYLGDET